MPAQLVTFFHRHPGLIFVLIGVALEGIELRAKWKKRRKHESILTEEPRWTLWVEFVSLSLVVIGLVLEIPDAAKTDKEASEFRSIAATTESNNLVLRSNIVALEAAVQWRTITPTQKDLMKFKVVSEISHISTNTIQLPTKNIIEVRVMENDLEARMFAGSIVDALKNCGFNAVLRSTMGFIAPDSKLFVGLGFIIKERMDINGRTLLKGNAGLAIYAFESIGLEPTYLNSDANMDDGSMIINVGHKPEY